MGIKVCARCGSKTTTIQQLDINIKSRLAEAGLTERLPNEVCMNCFAALKGQLSQSKVSAREKAKEENRAMLWKSRVPLIKKARQCMASKMYSDAAVSFEKYIRVLEIVFEAKQGGLKPELFKDSANLQEITVVASVYWDLLRLYDTHDKYRSRQDEAAQKLALFIRYTPIYPDIIKKAEVMVRTARNPAAFKSFLKSSSATRPRCFIATSAFENPFAPEVLQLCIFRDSRLIKNPMGRFFVKAYYFCSPLISEGLDRVSVLKPIVRWILRRIIKLIN